MNIIYSQNPLRTVVELDANEEKQFWSKIKIAQLEDLLFDAHFHIQDDEWADTEAARRAVNPDYYMSEDANSPSAIDLRVQVLFDHYIIELRSSHGGDCTCFCASCSKCQAEQMLGIDTIPALGNHTANAIDAIFRNEGVSTCSQAIEMLRSMASLNTNLQKALDWLVDYEKRHLGELTISSGLTP